jgi:threonylcarbamoyladenosine tRNA methylthiotransferase MtaB
MISFLIRNFGCRVNQAEAFGWADAFQSRGLKLEDDLRRSDLVIVNSCTLTSRADRDVRQFINKVTRTNPSARLILTGCYVERAREEFRNVPQVWMVFPNSEAIHSTAETAVMLFVSSSGLVSTTSSPKAARVAAMLSMMYGRSRSSS